MYSPSQATTNHQQNLTIYKLQFTTIYKSTKTPDGIQLITKLLQIQLVNLLVQISAEELDCQKKLTRFQAPHPKQ